MARRTINLTDKIDHEIRVIRVKIMVDENRSVSTTEVINLLLERGLVIVGGIQNGDRS